MVGRICFLLVIMLSVVSCSGLNALSALFDAPQEISLVGDPIRGKEIFKIGLNNNAPACSSCHLVREGGHGMSVAPNLHDIAVTGNERIEGLSAEDYIRDSILHPDNFLVSGFREQMYPDYETDLSEQDIADLIAYLMTLA